MIAKYRTKRIMKEILQKKLEEFTEMADEDKNAWWRWGFSKNLFHTYKYKNSRGYDESLLFLYPLDNIRSGAAAENLLNRQIFAFWPENRNIKQSIVP